MKNFFRLSATLSVHTLEAFLGGERGFSEPTAAPCSAFDAARSRRNHDDPWLSQSVWRIPSPHGNGRLPRTSSRAGLSLCRYGILRRDRNHPGIIHALLFARVHDRDVGGHLEGAFQERVYRQWWIRVSTGPSFNCIRS